MDKIKTEYIFDYDGIVSSPESEKLKALSLKSKEILGNIGWDIAKNASFAEKLYLYGIVAPILSTYKKLARIDKECYEERVLKMFETCVFKKINPKWEWVEKSIPKYSELISIEAEMFLKEISKKEYEKAIILTTGAPKEVVESCLEYRGIKDIDVIGNRLVILCGNIYGFEKEGFFSDRKGKKKKTEEIIERDNPSKIIGAGEDYSDLGVAEVVFEYGGEFYTIKNANKKLKRYVENNFGEKYIFPSPREIFNKI